MKKSKVLLQILLIFAVWIYSSSSVITKFAGRYELLSWQCLGLYCLSVMVLVLYSVIWQLLLEKTSLSKAYLAKGYYYLFVLLNSIMIFHEQVNWNQWVGVAIIVLGIFMGNTESKKEKEET